MTIDSTIEGETEVAHDILGNNNVRLLFRRLDDRCPLEDASESISDLIVDPRVKGGKGKEWSRVQYAAGRLVELCELPRKRVDADRDGFFIGENVPLEEADCNDSTAFVNPAATESCNGIDDDCNGSIDEVGCGTIEISAVLNITGGDGGSSGHEPLVGTEVRVYDVSSGSCADQSGGTPKTYSTIYGDGTFAKPGCVAETSGGTDVSGEITFPVEPGVYIVIGRPAPPHDDKLIGATVGIVGEGEVATKQIQLVVDGDGNEVPSRTD